MMDEVVVNIILILFPILIYFVASCYIGLNNNRKHIYLFDISICTSIYFCIKFGNTNNIVLLLLFCDIPVLVAYLKKKDKLAVLLSLLLLLYCCFNYEIGLCTLIIAIKYVSFFLIYLTCTKNDKEGYIERSAIFQAFYTSMLYFLNYKTTAYYIIDIFWIACVFFLTSFGIVHLFKLLDNLSNLFISVKDLEKDKQIKNSLFKLTHEIKNPLAVCKGYLEMMNLDDREKTEKYIGIIKQEIERSLLIMADFRELNKVVLTKELVDINFLIQEVYESLNLLVKSKNINLLFNNNNELYANVDFTKMKQVILNVIKNSVEAIDKDGKIEINTYKSGKHIYIEITDNGIGMDKTTKERLTELFFTTKKNGTGLGVALSNEIVNAHGGEVKYDSKLNVGTKVTIKLPIEN